MPTLLTPYGRHPGYAAGSVTFGGQAGPLAVAEHVTTYQASGQGFIEIPHDGLPSTIPGLTKEVWVYLPAMQQLPALLELATPNLPQAVYLEPYTNSAGQNVWVAGAYVGSGGNAFGGATQEIYTPSILSSWVYLVQTVSPTTLTLYVSAQTTVSATGTFDLSVIANGPWLLGGGTTVDGRGYLTGALAHAAVYLDVLPATRVAAHLAAAQSTQRGAYRAAVLADHPFVYLPLTDPSGPWAHDAVLWAA